MAELRVKGTGTLKLFENDNTSSVTIASPASLSADKTITLPDADVTLASGTMLATDGDGSGLSGVGKINQVVSASTTTQSSSTSSTFADVTNLSVAITPSSSSSKVLVTVFCNGVGKETNNAYMGLKLLRGITEIALVDHLVALNGGTASNYIGTSGIMYLDSPSTTSATTYKMQFNSEANNETVYINRPNSSNVATSTITLMEVLA